MRIPLMRHISWYLIFATGQAGAGPSAARQAVGQDIEIISLIPHGRSGGGIKVCIGDKTAHDRDGLGIPAIGLYRTVEPGLVDATGEPDSRHQ